MPQYLVFADYGQYCGLYRRLTAARRLTNELTRNGYMAPTIVPVNGEFTEEQFLKLGWGQRAGYWATLNCYEHGYFGRSLG